MRIKNRRPGERSSGSEPPSRRSSRINSVHGCGRYESCLAREASIPLVVDFRDSWSLDPHLGGGPVRQAAKRALCRWVYRPLERQVIESADAILMNTPSMQREYTRLLKRRFEHLHVVPNGFDETEFCEPVAPPPRERPLLLHCGRFSGVGGRSPELLLRAMRAVADSGSRAELMVLGDDSQALRRSIQRFALEEVVRPQATVSNREAVRAMREADVLVVYQAPSRNGVTPVAGKTFEYLRSGRPILAIVPPGDNADLVRRYVATHALITGEDPVRIAAAIQDLLRRAADVATAAPDPEFVDRFARRRVVQRIAAIFDATLQLTPSSAPIPAGPRVRPA